MTVFNMIMASILIGIAIILFIIFALLVVKNIHYTVTFVTIPCIIVVVILSAFAGIMNIIYCFMHN